MKKRNNDRTPPDHEDDPTDKWRDRQFERLEGEDSDDIDQSFGTSLDENW